VRGGRPPLLRDFNGRHVDGNRNVVGHHRRRFRRERASSALANRLETRTNISSTSAAPHACSWSAWSGCSEYVKIKTGMLGSACVTSVDTAGLKIEHVNS